MAKVLVDVVLKDGEDSTEFSDSFSSNTNVELKNPMVSIPSLVVMKVEESYFDTFKQEAEIQNEIFGSSEHREAVQAFLEKRQPKFD